MNQEKARVLRRAYFLILGLFLTSALLTGCGGGGGGGGGGGAGVGANLTGTVESFTAALEIEKNPMFAKIKGLLFSTAFAQASGVTVSVGGQSTTTDANGHFTINNIPTGDQTVTFTQGSTSATYSLNGVQAGEIITLNGIIQ